MTLSPKLFWLAILLYVAARLGLAALNYRGDATPESRERALKYFSTEVIERGTEYHRAGFGVSILNFLFFLAVLLVFILGGFSARLGTLCAEWSRGNAWLQVALYLTLLLLGSGILSLPFDYYFGYVIEHRFGLSKLNFGGWLLYQFKQALVGWILAVIIGSLAYALLRWFPRGWVVLVPVGALALQFTLTFLFPRLILPVFYKIEPLKDPELISAITGVTDKVGVKLKSLYLINESRYSSHTNAFFTGFGKFKEIYLYDTLLKDHSSKEVAAILAHELGHWKHNHVVKGMILSEAGIILACALLYFFFPILTRTEFLHTGGLGEAASLPTLLLLASVAGFFVDPIESSVSRFFERQADATGLELAPAPEVFIRDFKQLAISNHSDLLPHPAVVFWRYSHPPIVERIETTERSAARIQ